MAVPKLPFVGRAPNCPLKQKDFIFFKIYWHYISSIYNTYMYTQLHVHIHTTIATFSLSPHLSLDTCIVSYFGNSNYYCNKHGCAHIIFNLAFKYSLGPIIDIFLIFFHFSRILSIRLHQFIFPTKVYEDSYLQHPFNSIFLQRLFSFLTSFSFLFVFLW